jgi:hypothetical protein
MTFVAADFALPPHLVNHRLKAEAAVFWRRWRSRPRASPGALPDAFRCRAVWQPLIWLVPYLVARVRPVRERRFDAAHSALAWNSMERN